MLPQRNTKYVSYDLKLAKLKDIYTFSTRLESTSAIVAVGHDIFFARINPESNFDRLHENFKGIILFGVIGGLIAALVFANSYSKSKDQTEQFLTK